MDLATVTRSLEEIHAISKAAGAKVDTQIAAITELTDAQQSRILALEQKILTGNFGGGSVKGGGVLDIGTLIRKDARFDAFLKRDLSRFTVPLGQSLGMITKSVLTSQGASGVSPPTDFPSIHELVPGGVQGFAQRRLAVLEALPKIPVGSAIAEVPKLLSDSDAAAVQWPEGSAKSETVLEFIGEQYRSATIATYVNISRQLLADSPLAAEFIRTVLVYGCAKKAENLICTGTGDSADQILGLLNAGSVYTSSASHPADRIGEAIAYMAGIGYYANLIVMSPTAYFDLVAQKDSQDRYQGLGWNAAMPGYIWGVPVAPSAALSNSQALVLDTQQTPVLDRQEAQMSFGYTGTQFTENVVTALVELRIQLAVYDARAVQVVTIPADSPG